MPKHKKVVKKYVVIVAPEKEHKNLDYFMDVMKEVANDMKLTTYEEDTERLWGVDY